MSVFFLNQIPNSYSCISVLYFIATRCLINCEGKKKTPGAMLWWCEGAEVVMLVDEVFKLWRTHQPSISTKNSPTRCSIGQDLMGNCNRYAHLIGCVLYNVMRESYMMPRCLLMTGTPIQDSLTEITVIAPLVTLLKKVYMSILRRDLPKLLALSSGTSNHQSFQNIVIQQRKACSHPYLFAGIEPEPYEEGEHLVQASGKLVVLDQLLQKLQNSGHLVLSSAQMTHTFDVLQDYMELRKFPYERLDGS